MGFTKLSHSIFGSSIMEEDPQTRLVWVFMLAAADKSGCVDVTRAALARMFNLPEPWVIEAIDKLEQADDSSRSPAEEGRRLIRIDEHRNWGWKIVNHGLYRNTRDDDDRRTYERKYHANRRAIESRKNPPYPESLTEGQSLRMLTKLDAVGASTPQTPYRWRTQFVN